LNASDFREVVSGRRRGLTAALWRSALAAAELPYTCAVRWRNRQFDRGRKRIDQVGVPVVSVGNLTLGGTGKTPLVEWLARWFRDRGVRVTIISRGYGAEAGARNDEALELEQKLPDVPHVQNPDRVAAARMAIEEFECQLILLDDAFQHRRIHRDLDIVLLDALEPFGFGHVFPRGMLREPISGLSRADVVALSRGNLVDAAERGRIKAIVRKHAPAALWLECNHVPRELRSASGSVVKLGSLAGKPVAAFCGIGNPTGFRRTLEQCSFNVTTFREFPDHFSYQRADVESLAAWAAGLPVEAVLCTQKDLVKLGIDRLGPRPLWAVTIGLEIAAAQAEFEACLQKASTEIRSP
jgi:tetraacyldisaccharide 4'-kinase